MNAPIRVYLVEDHPAVRQGLRLMLELDGMHVCGEAEDARTALTEIQVAAPDLVMVDLSLGEDSGLDLIRALAQRWPELPTLAYSMFEDTLHVKRAFGAGARAYVTKREAPEILVQAIQECLAGRTFASPRVARSGWSSRPRAAWVVATVHKPALSANCPASMSRMRAQLAG